MARLAEVRGSLLVFHQNCKPDRIQKATLLETKTNIVLATIAQTYDTDSVNYRRYHKSLQKALKYGIPKVKVTE